MLHLELAVPTEWSRIDQVREAVGMCVRAVFGDRDLKDAVAMVSAELLENAFKYGAPAPVQLILHETQEALVVRVTNAVAAGSEHPRARADEVAWVNGQPSPQAAYEAALQRAFHQGAPLRSAPHRAEPGGATAATARSGLGLARIRYEGGCALACDTSRPGVVTVEARARRS